MSLTLLYRGKNVRFSMRLNKLYWLSAMLIFALISGFVIHLILSKDDQPSEVVSYLSNQDFSSQSSSYTINHIKASAVAEANLKNTTLKKQQLATLTIKLAELQNQVLRLNALGERLADNAKIPATEFNFQQLSPSGGPLTQVTEQNYKSFSQLSIEIIQLKNLLDHKENQLNILESLTLGHHIENSRYLSGMPISKGWLSSYFGLRKDPFTGRASMHKGIDFAGKEGGGIIATASGIVSWAAKRYGYGQLIEINHGDGIKTRYGHNKELLVKVGDVVTKGQIIAHMGSTGRSTGPHVHYEILHNDKQINPLKFVYRKAKSQ